MAARTSAGPLFISTMSPVSTATTEAAPTAIPRSRDLPRLVRGSNTIHADADHAPRLVPCPTAARRVGVAGGLAL